MRVIHFVEGATDFVLGPNAHQVRSVPLLGGDGSSNITCLHLLPGSFLTDAPIEQNRALLAVWGRVVVVTPVRIKLLGGMGIVLSATEQYSLESSEGAILITVDAKQLRPTPAGISTPERIMGQRWPDEIATAAPAKGDPSLPD